MCLSVLRYCHGDMSETSVAAMHRNGRPFWTEIHRLTKHKNREHSVIPHKSSKHPFYFVRLCIVLPRCGEMGAVLARNTQSEDGLALSNSSPPSVQRGKR